MSDGGKPLLAVRGLNAWYGESQALHGVDLDIFPGETVTLLGRNGVGKTTTLRAIMGLLSKRSGTLLFEGRDLLKVPLHRVAKLGMGFVPEERGIFASLSVEENLMLPPIVAPGGMSVEEIYTLFPNLKERRQSGGMQLSGGEQQMLAIARILRSGVKLLLLDEPTEGLAPVIVQRIGEILQVLKARGMTVLLVEQNFRFAAKVADRFYLMDHGRVLDGFPVGELPSRMTQMTETLGV
ncbi:MULTISPECIES: ABC transporter ATP-binding protein [unclassified Aureimonas]|uniref:ABC transporter ATP-binding protein n=1 Tax=unclassified Aureimonas TaxID=2615206 RepID=UPI0006FEDA7E|nr:MULTISPECIES: ABC transporter ATP-binding protein [unclassified Aureimonas]KQT69845.1 ABC transporter ATP-binding protein [Aureimonas sp. Leaf427]KQT76003.1 ABC transporter ATP-binding protein [Aureimonas sp. Leaf460]